MSNQSKNYNIRKEVMKSLEPEIDGLIGKYLTPIDKIWQPSDFLPNPQSDNFIEEVREIQEMSKDLDDDFWVVLVGDMITEEALPTYESWIMDIDGVSQYPENGWAKWVRQWTGEENRHGDVLNKYLYLSGRVNMREVEISTQHLIADGFDIGTAKDPYKNFIYTSFQELATFISHSNVGKIAAEKGHKTLSKMSRYIAGDEMRHHMAYSKFISRVFEVDPSEMMIAFSDMMKHKIIMPAMHMRESDGEQGVVFDAFASVAQKIGVYTGFDYIDIMNRLNSMWKIDEITGLTDDAEKARDYLMKLPDRMFKIAERHTPEVSSHQFKWLIPA
ncbi:MAG: acyl-[acyl-carrier-protein] desaturase [Planctomycetota bacterium]|jgi:acyl-[acyl-carrier-protein] desaturase